MSRRFSKMNRLLDKFDWLIGGHVTIGRLTIYGRNAMHYAWNYQLKNGEWVCFRPPSRCFGMKLGYYFYISRDGTPGSARYYRPRRHWPLVEPAFDPEYEASLEKGR